MEDLGNLANEWTQLFSATTFLEAAQPVQREVAALMYLETGDVAGFTIAILKTYLAYIKRGDEAKVLIFCSNYPFRVFNLNVTIVVAEGRGHGRLH